MRTLLAACCVVGGCAAAPRPWPPASSGLPDGIAPDALTFDDEFDHFVASPDGSVGWMTRYPYEGESARALPDNGEAEFYSDASVGPVPFGVQDGVLSITASRAPAGSNPYGLPYVSGLLTTFKSFAQTYGYFEIRAQLPAGRGLWPAFWLLQDDVVYDAELDVFEVLGKAPTVLNATTHWAINHVWSAHGQQITVPDTSAGFHTYGADWEPDTITFYMDGRAIATAPTPPTMHKPMYMLVNLAVGTPTSWPGPPDRTTPFPAAMRVDYVRAYASANTVQIGGTAAIRRRAAPPTR